MAKGLHHYVRETQEAKEVYMFRQAQWHSGTVSLSTAASSVQHVSMLLAAWDTRPSKVLFHPYHPSWWTPQGKIHMKRKPSKAGISKVAMAKNTQRIAEERVARHFPDLEVLNSYWVGEDGKHKFFEVILTIHTPAIINDKQLGNSAKPTETTATVAVHTVAEPLESVVVVSSTRARVQKAIPFSRPTLTVASEIKRLFDVLVLLAYTKRAT